MKPFIKLFRTPRGYYFYDVNRDMICPVDKNTFNDLEVILADDSVTPSENIQKLMEQGWLSSKRPISVKRELRSDVLERIEHNAHALIIQITQSCNLTCIYCPFAINKTSGISRVHSSKNISFATAKKAIDFIYKKSIDVDWINIGFYGGEPLIAFDLIKDCVDYAKELFDGKRLGFFVTTNATLMTDSLIDYLYNNRFVITFSVDGPETIHDRHRLRADGSPTYKTVIDNLKKTIAKYGEESNKYLSINMVINPSDDLDEITKWMNDPLFRRLRVDSTLVETSMIEEEFNTSDDFAMKMSYQKAIEYIRVLCLSHGIAENKLFSKEMTALLSDYGNLKNDAICLPDNNTPSGPCIPGFAKLFVNTDGYLYPCERVNELSKCMIIGDVENGYDYTRIQKQINIAELTPDSCRNCFAQWHCNICQRQADGGNELSAVNKRNYCGSSKDDFLDTLLSCAMIYECKTRCYDNQ